MAEANSAAARAMVSRCLRVTAALVMTAPFEDGAFTGFRSSAHHGLIAAAPPAVPKVPVFGTAHLGTFGQGVGTIAHCRLDGAGARL